MASITLTGTLLDPTGEVAVGDQIRFTHRTTTGETIQFARSVLIIPPNGLYNITLEFGLIFVEYLDIKDVNYKSLGVVTVNQDSTATDLPGLLNAIVPPTDAQLLLFQGILQDTEDARDIALLAAAQQTTLELIASTTTHPNSTVLTLSGHTLPGDGGGGKWQLNGVVGQTPSQSPTQLADFLLNDGNGNQWALVDGVVLAFNGVQYLPLPFGATGNGNYAYNNNDFDKIVDPDRLNPATLSDWQNDTSAQLGDVVTTAERSAGNAGGATGNVIASGTENGFNIIKHNTLPLSWELRTNKVTLNTLEWGMLESNTAAQNSAVQQAAIDFGNALFTTSPISNGGVDAYTPSGAYEVEGWIDKQGVNIKGDGRVNTAFLLVGDNKTGMKNASAASQSFTDQLSFGVHQGFSFLPKDPSVELPVGQLIWDITGYSRWTTIDVFIGWCGGCTGIQMTGATTAGNLPIGGPANWYNNFYDVFVERPSAFPAGGVGWLLGDTAADKEQITTWGIHGGRTSGANSGTGFNIQSCNSLNFFNHVIESCDVLIGSPGAARKAISVNFYPAYFEGGSGSNLTIDPNAEDTQFHGEFITGYTLVDNGTRTLRNGGGATKMFAGSAGARFFDIECENSAAQAPTFRDLNGLMQFFLEDSAGNEVRIRNTTSVSSATQKLSITDTSNVNIFQSGASSTMISGATLNVNNDSLLGRFASINSPEGVITAKTGSSYYNGNGGAGTTLFVKESGAGNTGWIAK